MASVYRWLPKAAVYYDMGAHRFVAKRKVLSYVAGSISQSSDSVVSLTQHYLDGGLSIKDWTQMVRQELKLEHIRQYVLGRGGREQMTPSDWGQVGNLLKKQYKFLDGFAKALQNGTSIGGRALVRAAMYPGAARAAYERGNRAAQLQKSNPPAEVLWGLGNAEHCPKCVEFNAMGWVPIEDDPYDGAYPGSGDTPCLTHCQCELQYR